MFDTVRNNKRLAQIILAGIAVPFVFFGMDAFFHSQPGADEVASVGGSPISAAEFSNALREQQDALRNARGGQVDRAMLESPELRRTVLENLVNQRVLLRYAADSHFSVTKEEMQEAIGKIPAFQENGQFSVERYKAVVSARMSVQSFEAGLAQDLRAQQIAAAVSATGFVSDASARRLLAAQLEEREVREMRFPVADYRDGVKPGDGAAAAYYEANTARFERPARLKAEYLVFDEAAARRLIAVSDEEARAFYDNPENAARFEMPEERKARHILILADEKASGDEVAQAKARIEAIGARLRKNPAQFEAIAKESSQDPGSASRGGDLGFFARGIMDPAFEDAAFSQPKGEIGAPVRSSFGFHIIQVTGSKAASKQSFENARAEIIDELATQAAKQRFAQMADQFANTVYEQADSLKAAAEAMKLEIRHSDWIERGAKAFGPYRNEQLLGAVFSDDSVRDRRNTAAIDLGNNTLVAARVTEFEAAQRLPLETVKSEIEQQLHAEAAAKAAAEKGAATLAALEKGEAASGEWGASRKLQRMAPTVSIDAMRAVFSAPAAKLPAYVGVSAGDGYTLYRIDAVNRATLAENDPRIKEIANEFGALQADRDFRAFLGDLRERYKVEMSPEKTAAVE